MSAPSPKFKSDLHIRTIFGDHFLVADTEIFVLSNKERMELQQKRLELAKGKEKEESDFHFANYVMSLFSERVASISAQIYAATPELKEMSQDELEAVDTSTLDLVDQVTDMDTLGYYDFSIIVYQHITEAFAQGLKPGKKLRTS